MFEKLFPKWQNRFDEITIEKISLSDLSIPYPLIQKNTKNLKTKSIKSLI